MSNYIMFLPVLAKRNPSPLTVEAPTAQTDSSACLAHNTFDLCFYVNANTGEGGRWHPHDDVLHAPSILVNLSVTAKGKTTCLEVGNKARLVLSSYVVLFRKKNLGHAGKPISPERKK